MIEKNQQASGQESGQETNAADREKHNPFKETAAPTEESPAEDAEAEQQRKEALTERD